MIRKLLRSTFAVLLLAAGGVGIEAADVFVSPTGDNANTGGETDPYQSISVAFRMAVDGDRLVLLPGKYSECVTASNFLSTDPNDDQDKPITLVSKEWVDFLATNPTEAAQDAWRPSGTADTPGISSVVEAEPRCQLTGLVPAPTILIGSTNSAVYGLIVTMGGEAGIDAFGTVTVSNNVIENNFSPRGGGIYFYSATCYFGDSVGVIENNDIRNNQGFFNAVDGVGGDGGGIYANVTSVVADPLSTCGFLGNPDDFDDELEDGDSAQLTIQDNLVEDNVVNTVQARRLFGAGLFAVTNTSINDSGDVSTSAVTITNNLIQNNDMMGLAGGYGGGAFVSTYGFGIESIDFVDNTLQGNSSTFNSIAGGGDGGGISAWIQSASGSEQEGTGDTQIDHRLTIEDNLVTGNTAAGRGGGIDLFMISEFLTQADARLQIIAAENTISDNDAAEAADLGGGGGLLATLLSFQTAPDTAQGGLQEIRVSDNIIVNNRSTFVGGGLGLLITADGDPLDTTPPTTEAPPPATADAVVERNLIANNETLDANTATGSGIFAFVEAYGPGDADIFIDRATVSNNIGAFSTDPDLPVAGGVHFESITDFDRGGFVEGSTQTTLANSIVTDNDGIEIGGAFPGVEEGFIALADSPSTPNSGEFELTIAFNDIFDTTDILYDGWVGDQTGSNGNIATDPLLVTNTGNGDQFVPDFCSGAMDGADPALGTGDEPLPNGGRINMGYRGGTARAGFSLPDLNGDQRVDGAEWLRLAASWAGRSAPFVVTPDPWYDTTADINADGIISGTDLSIVMSAFAQFCGN